MKDRLNQIVGVIFRLLEIIENDTNERVIAQIKGLLNELKNL